MRFGFFCALAGLAAGVPYTISACSGASFIAADASAADAGSESTSDAVANRSPCTLGAQHTLCDDFDRDGLAPWWNPRSGCAPPVVDSKDSVSPPSSLFAATDTLDAAACATVNTKLVTMQAPTRVNCELDVRADVPPPGRFDFFAIGTILVDGSYYELDLGLDGTLAQPVYVEEFLGSPDGGPSSTKDTAVAGLLDLQSWHHVAFQLDLSARTAAVALDHVPSSSIPLAFLSMGVTGLVVHVGVYYADRGVSTHVRQDNLVCDVK